MGYPTIVPNVLNGFGRRSLHIFQGYCEHIGVTESYFLLMFEYKNAWKISHAYLHPPEGHLLHIAPNA